MKFLFRSFFVLVLVMVWQTASFAEDLFYYHHGVKMPLTLSSEKISVKFAAPVTRAQVAALLADESEVDPSRIADVHSEENLFTIGLKTQADVKALLQRLHAKTGIAIASPVYLVRGVEAIPTDRFIVKLRSAADKPALDALNASYDVRIVNELSNPAARRYTLRVMSTSSNSILELAQLYYENLPTAAWALPDFIRPVIRSGIPNDTHFSRQYYFHNDDDVDINAPEAWDLSTGSSSIIVAVLDAGGEAHEDLPASRIVAGYDYVDMDADPAPDGNEAHGMAVAGIIAATQNNSKGIAGLAPNCKVMFVRVFDKLSEGVSEAKFAQAIDFAWQNGAGVVNNSWNYSSSDPNLVPVVTDAIDNALTQGRGGKGSVVVFSAGNNGGSLLFPANRPGVLAVGAVDQTNNVWGYSAKGPELAVVAPSGAIPTLGNLDPCNAGEDNGQFHLHGDVWTLDRPGEAGWNPGDYRVCTAPFYYHEYLWSPPSGAAPSNNYTAHFSGTSASAPQVSGTAALMLSVNPELDANLSNPQVQCIIKEKANHPGGPGNFDNNYGYGRLDAFAAVEEAGLVTGIHDPPSAPGNLVITNKGSIGQNPNLTWSASADADYYHVYRRVSFYPDWLFMGSTGSTSYTDNTLDILDESDPMAEEFLYHVKAVNSAGESGPSNTDSVWGFSFYKQNAGKQLDISKAFELAQNYPNPFNPETELRFSLPVDGQVELGIVNLLGQTIRTLAARHYSAGQYSVMWDGRDEYGKLAGSGIYFYRLVVKSSAGHEAFVAVRKMSLLR